MVEVHAQAVGHVTALALGAKAGGAVEEERCASFSRPLVMPKVGGTYRVDC